MASAQNLSPDVVEALEGAARPEDTGDLLAEVAASAAPKYVADLQDEPRWTHPEPNLRSAYFTPVAFGAATLGILALFASEADAFSPDYRRLADVHAREVGQRWWLSEQVTLSAGELREQLASADEPEDAEGKPHTLPNPAWPADAQAHTLAQLSERERDVVMSLCRGRRLAEIARELGISHHTARNHMKRVFKKLGVHSQVELLVILGSTRGRTGMLLR